MTTHAAKPSDYKDVTSECIYDYIRKYAQQIYQLVEPEEDGTGNSYKLKQEQFANCNRTTLKSVAAELETVVKRLNYGLNGKY